MRRSEKAGLLDSFKMRLAASLFCDFKYCNHKNDHSAGDISAISKIRTTTVNLIRMTRARGPRWGAARESSAAVAAKGVMERIALLKIEPI